MTQLFFSLLLFLLSLWPWKSSALKNVHYIVTRVVRVFHNFLVEYVHGKPRSAAAALRAARTFLRFAAGLSAFAVRSFGRGLAIAVCPGFFLRLAFRRHPYCPL